MLRARRPKTTTKHNGGATSAVGTEDLNSKPTIRSTTSATSTAKATTATTETSTAKAPPNLSSPPSSSPLPIIRPMSARQIFIMVMCLLNQRNRNVMPDDSSLALCAGLSGLDLCRVKFWFFVRTHEHHWKTREELIQKRHRLLQHLVTTMTVESLDFQDSGFGKPCPEMYDFIGSYLGFPPPKKVLERYPRDCILENEPEDDGPEWAMLAEILKDSIGRSMTRMEAVDSDGSDGPPRVNRDSDRSNFNKTTKASTSNGPRHALDLDKQSKGMIDIVMTSSADFGGADATSMKASFAGDAAKGNTKGDAPKSPSVRKQIKATPQLSPASAKATERSLIFDAGSYLASKHAKESSKASPVASTTTPTQATSKERSRSTTSQSLPDHNGDRDEVEAKQDDHDGNEWDVMKNSSRKSESRGVGNRSSSKRKAAQRRPILLDDDDYDDDFGDLSEVDTKNTNLKGVRQNKGRGRPSKADLQDFRAKKRSEVITIDDDDEVASNTEEDEVLEEGVVTSKRAGSGLTLGQTHDTDSDPGMPSDEESSQPGKRVLSRFYILIPPRVKRSPVQTAPPEDEERAPRKKDQDGPRSRARSVSRSRPSAGSKRARSLDGTARKLKVPRLQDEHEVEDEPEGQHDKAEDGRMTKKAAIRAKVVDTTAAAAEEPIEKLNKIGDELKLLPAFKRRASVMSPSRNGSHNTGSINNTNSQSSLEMANTPRSPSPPIPTGPRAGWDSETLLANLQSSAQSLPPWSLSSPLPLPPLLSSPLPSPSQSSPFDQQSKDPRLQDLMRKREERDALEAGEKTREDRQQRQQQQQQLHEQFLSQQSTSSSMSSLKRVRSYQEEGNGIEKETVVDVNLSMWNTPKRKDDADHHKDRHDDFYKDRRDDDSHSRDRTDHHGKDRIFFNDRHRHNDRRDGRRHGSHDDRLGEDREDFYDQERAYKRSKSGRSAKDDDNARHHRSQSSRSDRSTKDDDNHGSHYYPQRSRSDRSTREEDDNDHRRHHSQRSSSRHAGRSRKEDD